jgi:hypothetical protein
MNIDIIKNLIKVLKSQENFEGLTKKTLKNPILSFGLLCASVYVYGFKSVESFSCFI